MLTLKGWYLAETVEGTICAIGSVFGHYRIPMGEQIYTSDIEKIYLRKEGSYVIETHSGSLYQLEEEDFMWDYAENTKRLLKTMEMQHDDNLQERLDRSDEDFRRRKELWDNQVKEAEEWADKHMKDNELYLVVEGTKVLKAIFKYRNISREVKPYIHVGTHQDSVLLRYSEEGEEVLDFRYFPRGTIEPYEWTENLKSVYICNIGRNQVFFEAVNGMICCQSEQVTKIKRKVYKDVYSDCPDFWKKGFANKSL